MSDGEGEAGSPIDMSLESNTSLIGHRAMRSGVGGHPVGRKKREVPGQSR
jgi:hypothetical protein